MNFEELRTCAVGVVRTAIHEAGGAHMIARLKFLNRIITADRLGVADTVDECDETHLNDSVRVDSLLALYLIAMKTSDANPLAQIARNVPGSIRWNSTQPPFTRGALAAFVHHALLNGLVGDWEYLDPNWDHPDGIVRIMVINARCIISIAVPDTVVWMQEQGLLMLRTEVA